MGKISLFFFLLSPACMFAQQFEEPKSQRDSVFTREKPLRDTIGTIEQNVDSLSTKQNSQPAQEHIEVLPETPQLQVAEDVLLRTSPSKKGTTVLRVKKGTIIQKIDEVKGYYLVCVNGNCGYILKKYVAKMPAE